MEGDKIVEKVTYIDTAARPNGRLVSDEPRLKRAADTVLGEIDNDALVSETAAKTPIKRGRKPKYFSEEDRRMAKREQNRKYRDRKREELIALRRLAASADNPHIKIIAPVKEDEDIPIEL